MHPVSAPILSIDVAPRTIRTSTKLSNLFCWSPFHFRIEHNIPRTYARLGWWIIGKVPSYFAASRVPSIFPYLHEIMIIGHEEPLDPGAADRVPDDARSCHAIQLTAHLLVMIIPLSCTRVAFGTEFL